MPDRTRHTRTNPTPHFDGKRDTVVNDSSGVEIGIKMDAETPLKNPAYIPQKKNDQIKELENE